ncbi:hypothetical protein BH11PLA1_BH11PLA1_22010 [soil metagenome]
MADAFLDLLAASNPAPESAALHTPGATIALDRAAALFSAHEREVLPRLSVLWAYYRNPVAPSWWLGAARAIARRTPTGGGAAGGVRLAQERGLPNRFWTAGALRSPLDTTERGGRREIVIENDIAWRIQTMVDFLFNRPVRLTSTAADAPLAAQIDAALEAAWEASGGMSLLQDAALLAHVYGHVDLLVRVIPAGEAAGAAGADAASDLGLGAPGESADAPGAAQSVERLIDAARRIRIEIVDPSRGVPVVSAGDYRLLEGYIVRTAIEQADGTALATTEVFTAATRSVYEQRLGVDGAPLGGAKLVERDTRSGDAGVPVVHIQNVSQPFVYSGLSEVEPLIPLQDELNTRLSDRANRVTMQSFKMYLAKGVEGFDQSEIGPGVVWLTENENAKIESFGGDAASPSEESHIDEVREAIDKVSGVPPLAAGVVRAKIGNLTSENALRVTLQGLLTRTARKRSAWGRGIAGVSRLVLAELDRQGALVTRPAQRGINVDWADALPRDVADELKSAQIKRDLGVDPQRVLSDLGIGAADRGVE